LSCKTADRQACRELVPRTPKGALFNPEILTGFAWVGPQWGIKQGWGGENKLFSSFMHRYLENSTRYDQSYC